jgi:ubiquinone/menaquinone biosynthesis C-methylase UbiE
MSKHEQLLTEELNNFNPNLNTLSFIDSFLERKNRKKNKVNILDWGCGRGREVLWLRLKGYNVIGVDIDNEPINNGLVLAKQLGFEEGILQLLLDDNKTPFPENYFDITFSNQVFEHIEDINSVAKEIYRITKKDGEGYHVFPSFMYPNEGHLHMPFVHWLPKNQIRYLIILIYVLIRREPFWPELSNLNLLGKAKAYYNYSINKTYYRKPKTLTNIFSNAGFNVKHGSKYIGMNSNNSLSYWQKIKQYLRIIFKEDELYLF